MIARTELERERDELQHKFELALQDVQRLRERVAEMEHDLARRPGAAQADSTELVALRAERDALVEQVERLESRPTTQIDPDVEQQVSDLQRRFEMAVEDVRELKTKNAKLESQLASAGTHPATPQHDAGGMDWESQKRRLLASLEDGANREEDAASQQARATIEGTIEITDAVVAEKDRQLAQLTAELDALRNNPTEPNEVRDQKVIDLIDADEIIAEHRKRSQQMERETEDKLRAAELELSVERAKWRGRRWNSRSCARTSNPSGRPSKRTAVFRCPARRDAAGSRSLASMARTKSRVANAWLGSRLCEPPVQPITAVAPTRRPSDK